MSNWKAEKKHVNFRCVKKHIKLTSQVVALLPCTHKEPSRYSW